VKVFAVLMLRMVVSAVNVDAAMIGRRFSRLSALGWHSSCKPRIANAPP
jgi:hypothetical protein